ncbi:MAG: MATE family efflux transporter [Oscillospiraceae bacterium]|nr:MATE family efflux transporter [Oscillospiraceae bacterium]
MGNEALFRDKPVWKAIFTLAIPSVLTILIMVLYNMADMFFIGMLGDDTQVAAVAVVGPVFSLATAVATMLGAGGCAVIAKALGAQEHDTARRVGSLCIWASILFGAVFTAVMLSATDIVLSFLGATEDLIGYAATYMRILALGSPLMLFSVVMASVVRAEGAILPGMLSNMTGTVTNIILDPVFILGLNMGVAGAAIATVLGNLVATLLLTVFIRKRSGILSFSPKYALQRPSLLLHTMAVGLPNGISSVLSGFASTFSNQLLSLYGSSAIAAMAAAGRSTMVITMIQMGICMGASPLMAYNYGARNIPRIREILQKVAILTVGFGLLAAISCYLSRDALIGLFLKEPSNAEIGSQLMFFLIIASPLLGFYYLSSNFLQAAGNAFLATVVSILRQGALLIPCLYLMHCFFGLTGIAAAHTVSDVCAVMIAVGFCLWQYRKLVRTASAQ